MEKEKSLMDKMFDLFFKLPKVSKSIKINRFDFYLYENNAVGFSLDNHLLTKFFSYAKTSDNRIIDTKTAKFKKLINDNNIVKLIYEDSGIRLTQVIEVSNNSYFNIKAVIENVDGSIISTNYIRPFEVAYPDRESDPLFSSLDMKMLLIPYDNDMWVRYESTPLRPGRTSYEVSCIYNEDDLNGLLIGALDFDNFKNAIKCSDHDARVYYALSGIADDSTHDIVPHGFIDGLSIESSRFMIGYYTDIRDALEEYAKVVMSDKEKMEWEDDSIFGWNSYSAGCMTLEQWEEAGNFLRTEVTNFKDQNNRTCINLDANFMLNKTKMKKIVDNFHKNNQLAGNYLAPALGNEMFELISPLKGTKGAKYKDIIMKYPDGTLYPKIDGGKPVDVTHPAFIKDLEIKVNEIIDLGFDYIKVDFTSHAGVEGIRYNKDIKTGRQALTFFYKTLKDLLDYKKVHKKIFLDFSISPLFPAGFAHARRASCDAFGHHEDVRYVLNALNFGWWQSGALYSFNDPDHTVLYKSKMDNRGVVDYNSAKSRYNASIISGTVMLLSDNFGPIGKSEDIKDARNRVLLIANNERINEIARFKKAFRPAYLKSDTTNIYYLNYMNRSFVAFFNFKKTKETYSIESKALNMIDSGILYDLRYDTKKEFKDIIEVTLDGYDSVILEVLKRS